MRERKRERVNGDLLPELSLRTLQRSSLRVTPNCVPSFEKASSKSSHPHPLYPLTLSWEPPPHISGCSHSPAKATLFRSAMESREEVVVVRSLEGLTGVSAREPQGKPGHRSCLSPGAAPYSRERTTELVSEESARKSMCADRPVTVSSSGVRHHKDVSSSDNESDFYEEIDVSCTPESMDYPTSKGSALFWKLSVFASEQNVEMCIL